MGCLLSHPLVERTEDAFKLLDNCCPQHFIWIRAWNEAWPVPVSAQVCLVPIGGGTWWSVGKEWGVLRKGYRRAMTIVKRLGYRAFRRAGSVQLLSWPLCGSSTLHTPPCPAPFFSPLAQFHHKLGLHSQWWPRCWEVRLLGDIPALPSLSFHVVPQPPSFHDPTSLPFSWERSEELVCGSFEG